MAAMVAVTSNTYGFVIFLVFLVMVITDGVQATVSNDTPESENVTKSDDLSTKQNETSADSTEEEKPKDDSVVLITGGNHIDLFQTVEVLDPLSTGCHPSFGDLPSHTFFGHTTHFVAPDQVFLVGGLTLEEGKNCLILNNNGDKQLEFQKHSLLNVPRSFHRGVLVDRRIWIFGGVNALDKTESLDAAVSKPEWREEAVAAGARFKCSVAIDNKTLVDTGGESGRISITDVKKLDTETATWSDMEAMETPRMNHACVYLEDSDAVLVAGGQKSEQGKEDEYLKSAEIYHVNTGKWEAAGNMVEARSHGQMVVVGGRVLFIGGMSSHRDKRKETVEEFDQESKTWSKVANLRLQRGRATFSAVVVPTKALGCGVTSAAPASGPLMVVVALLAAASLAKQ